jgi:undecaprenyl-phosphate galactose phosphotransferase
METSFSRKKGVLDMSDDLELAREKRMIEVKPSKRDLLLNNKIVYAFTIVTKRLIDICAGVAGMCVLIPLTIILYIVKVVDKDKGPLFFSQDRIGKDGKLFKMYKFRTMVVGADDILKKMLEEDEEARKEYSKNKKLKNDPRVTKIGKFLRSTSLDEFPQFINVLKGDMSLVGPRPYLPREEEDMGYYYYYITKCKPGITGLWQVSGRSELTFEERLDLDLEYYKDDVGVLSDLGLAAKTVVKTLKKEGAA